jgi:Flp pilus assembly pilin Flp
MTNTVLKRFLDETDGAVTVDWVVLTAAIVGLGIAVVTTIATSVGNVTQAADADLQQADTFAGRVADAVNQ